MATDVLYLKRKKYNLQFFAKDGPGGEKTEEATPKKLQDARAEGQVAKSKDLNGAVTLLAFFVIFKVYLGIMGEQFITVFDKVYNRIGELFENPNDIISSNYYISIVFDIIINVILLILPFVAVAMVFGFVMDVVQVKWHPTTKPLTPKFDKLNPVNGFKRMFSIRQVVELLKQLAMIILIAVVCYTRLKNKTKYFYNLYDISLNSAIMFLGDIILDLGIVISVVYIIVGVVDYVFQKRKFKEEMRMTKQEVKEEWKNTEGSPEVKQKQRQRMQEVSRRRMMQAIPEADVVITNPTHFAVALKYEQQQGKAPIVVAKGADYLAAKIKETAKENDVEIVENKPLARMLYYNVEIGEEIPPELYQAVADVLVFVYKLKNKLA